jgi:3-deoxy-D-manno-octulosonate 8-phosphate phosphatase (KDO 8-P phosphatase)
MNIALNEIRSLVKIIVLDVDGTLTDGKVYITDQGHEFKQFDVRDGLAMGILLKEGIELAILSHAKTPSIVLKRAAMLGISRIYVGQEPKALILQKWMNELKISGNNVLFMGDDLNDLDAFALAAYTVCPADACPAIRNKSSLILTKKGGDGAFRELAELLYPEHFYTNING